MKATDKLIDTLRQLPQEVLVQILIKIMDESEIYGREIVHIISDIVTELKEK